jgi:hypothetical protein
MKYVQLGRCGLRVSRVCLGMMSFGNPPPGHPSWRAWHLTGDGGVTFFDTADSYSGGASEQITGSLLRSCFARREDYVLATKVYFPGQPGGGRGLSAKRIAACADASLRRLGTDYIDLYQLHRWDYGTPVEETMAALAALVRSGRPRSDLRAGRAGVAAVPPGGQRGGAGRDPDRAYRRCTGRRQPGAEPRRHGPAGGPLPAARHPGAQLTPAPGRTGLVVGRSGGGAVWWWGGLVAGQPGSRYGAAVGDMGSHWPRPGAAVTSPSSRTTSPRLMVKRGQPWTSWPS